MAVVVAVIVAKVAVAGARCGVDERGGWVGASTFRCILGTGEGAEMQGPKGAPRGAARGI